MAEEQQFISTRASRTPCLQVYMGPVLEELHCELEFGIGRSLEVFKQHHLT